MSEHTSTPARHLRSAVVAPGTTAVVAGTIATAPRPGPGARRTMPLALAGLILAGMTTQATSTVPAGLSVTILTAAAADGPSVTTSLSGGGAGEGSTQGVACDVLIRYDDGSDDFTGIGRTLGGANNETQGILATPPGTASTWLVQSAGFFADFWIQPGIVNVVVQSRAVPALSATEPIFVDGGGVWEVVFSQPVCLAGDFDVLICPEPGVHGVSGEDVAAPDIRSFHQIQACANFTPVHNLDLMIWTCVTPCDPVPTERRSWGSIKGRFD